MKIKISPTDILVFDLDKTIWNCEDKYGNCIWAKQIIFPIIKQNNYTIIDDCGSKCTLDKEFKSFLDQFKNEKVFLSNGCILNTNLYNQPSIKLLKIFNLYDSFSKSSLLTYKFFRKKDFFSKEYNYIFFDDDDSHLKQTAVYDNIVCVDRKKFSKWNNLQIIE